MENIILTIYYAKNKDPQRNIYQKENNFNYIKNFYNSVVKNKMTTVIFHDCLTDEFMLKHASQYIIYQKIPDKKYNLTSMNDIRFMIYLDYLKEHPEIKKVIVSDIADVEFYANVFSDINQNKLYACYDRNRTFKHYYLTDRIKLTYQSMEPFDGLMNHLIVQAGLFAGSYEMIIKCLTHMAYEFENMVDPSYNTNYIVFNHVVYNDMLNDVVFTTPGNDIKTKCGKEIKMLSWKE